MSYDLAVWYSDKRLPNHEAEKLYARLCEGDTSDVLPSPAVDAFYSELTSKHPEIDKIPPGKDDNGLCPWSYKFDRSPGHVILSCVWPKASYVHRLVQGLARKHGLALFDPQEGEVIYPDGQAARTGMSRGARWTLGCFALLFAWMLAYSQQLSPSNAPVLVYGIAAFCLLIAIACFSQSWRGPAVRVIGFTVFLAYLFYFGYELVKEPEARYGGRTEPHWLNAIFGFIAFGLPGLHVALRGNYPKWGKGAAVFHGPEASPPEQDPPRGNK